MAISFVFLSPLEFVIEEDAETALNGRKHP
jgi:hypothetical protein